MEKEWINKDYGICQIDWYLGKSSVGGVAGQVNSKQTNQPWIKEWLGGKEVEKSDIDTF